MTIRILMAVCLLVVSCRKKSSDSVTELKPKIGGTLIYAKNGPPVTLDPALTAETESTIPCDNIFDALVQVKLGTTGLAPALAKTWDISSDAKTYTFHLRNDVKFHDGSPFNAEAVLFTFNRQRNASHAFYQKGDKFEYWKNFSMGDVIKDIRAVNDSTVQFELREANSTFLYLISMDFLAIVSPAAMQKYGPDFEKNPVGTGAFRFVSWSTPDELVLEANLDYWDGRPYLDKLIFKAIGKSDLRLNKLLSGEYQMIESPPKERMADLTSNENIKLFKQPGVNIAYLAMNMNKKPFQDIRVRQAITYAINRDKLVKEVYGEFGRSAKNPIPPMLMGYNDEIRPTPYDPAQSKKLLADAGFPKGFKTTLWQLPIAREYMPDGAKAALLIQADLELVGITCEIKTAEWREYLEHMYRGDHDLGMMGWVADIPDPDNFFFPLLDKTVADQVPSNNIAFYRGEEMHQLLMKGKIVADAFSRAQIYKDACRIFNRDLPWFTIAHSQVVIPMQSFVMNFQPYGSYARKFHQVWLNN